MEGGSVSTAVSSVNTREMTEIPSISNEMYLKVDYIPDAFRIDASPFINRPYFVSSGVWSTSNAQYTIVGNFGRRKLPGDVIRSNASLLNAMKIGSYYRSSLCLQISVAGTISHAGMLLVGILPPLLTDLPNNLPQRNLINTILSGPHGFLAANEATSICLEVPWYCNSDLATLDMEIDPPYVTSGDITTVNGNYATLVMMVLNPLVVAGATSTTLSITIDATFKFLDIMVPTPRYVTYVQSSILKSISKAIDSGTEAVKSISGDFIDNMRAAFRSYTGLHNPNSSSIDHRMIHTNRNFLNSIDETTFFETLDPNPNVLRYVDRPIFGTSVDEMAISHIISKKQYMGTVRVTTNDAVGTLLWSRPISPFQGGLSTTSVLMANNIELLHRLTRAWKGDIKITIQSVMNNKQQIKLRLLQMYNPSTAVLTGYPSFGTILSAPSHLMEFTAGNQTQEVVLPFLCRNNLCPNMRDMNSEAIFHGMYYIYSASFLANSDSSPVDVNFNIYISLEPGFTFYGYSTESCAITSPVAVTAVALKEQQQQVLQDKLEADKLKEQELGEADKVDNVVVGVNLTAFEQSIDVMNEPQDQEEMLKVSRASSVEEFDRLMPLHDLRPLMRRLNLLSTSPVTIPPTQTSVISVPVSSLYNQVSFSGAVISTPAEIVNAMFYGRTGGVKVSMSFKLRFETGQANPAHAFSCSINFVPPNYHVITPANTFLGCNISPTSSAFRKFKAGASKFSVPYTVLKSSSEQVYEFKVPDAGFYKFIGSPYQLSPSAVQPTSLPSTADMGTIVFCMLNDDPTLRIEAETSFSFAYTDETRLGFHTMAPVVTVTELGTRYETPYLGTSTTASALPLKQRNQYIYFTRS